MPYTDFHYTPTGTGVISGKEVLEQTEDAINNLGTQISGDVQTAIDTANNALNTANTASVDAQNAVNTANTAYTTATNAQNTANTAQNTASNALTAAQNAQNDVNALGNRVTTAENNITQNTTDISGLTTRMGTAEGNITTLQNDVVTAQGTATSAQNTATMARQQAYVLRYSSTAITDNSTIAYSTLDNTDNIKANDKIIDVDGKIFSVVSVDSDNSTVTVGSALIDLALDANVMHLSGNETAAGPKTFNSNTSIYNSDNSAATPNLYLRSSKIEISSQGNTSGDQNLTYSDRNNTTYAYVKGAIQSNGSAVKISAIAKDSSDNSVVNELQILANTNGRKIIFPSNTNETELGTSSYKWKDVNTVLISGLTPSSLSLPNYAQRIDIAGYITDLTGGNNTYTPVANGYIYLRTDTGLMLEILDVTSGIGSSSIVQSSDKLRIFLPVVAQRNVYIKAKCTSLVSAVFVPCFGNV